MQTQATKKKPGSTSESWKNLIAASKWIRSSFFWPYIGLGNREKALDSLEQALSRHSNIITSLKVEPAFDSLRGDPRFQELLRRAGFTG